MTVEEGSHRFLISIPDHLDGIIGNWLCYMSAGSSSDVFPLEQHLSERLSLHPTLEQCLSTGLSLHLNFLGLLVMSGLI